MMALFAIAKIPTMWRLRKIRSSSADSKLLCGSLFGRLFRLAKDTLAHQAMRCHVEQSLGIVLLIEAEDVVQAVPETAGGLTNFAGQQNVTLLISGESQLRGCLGATLYGSCRVYALMTLGGLDNQDKPRLTYLQNIDIVSMSWYLVNIIEIINPSLVINNFS